MPTVTSSYAQMIRRWVKEGSADLSIIDQKVHPKEESAEAGEGSHLTDAGSSGATKQLEFETVAPPSLGGGSDDEYN